MMQTSTCIVGLECDGKVYIGGDSAGVNESLDMMVRGDEKVFVSNNMIFGFTGSFRMGQLLRYAFVPPSQSVGQTDFEYLCCQWTDALIECLKNKGCATIENNTINGGTFLLGYHGKLYQVQDDFQIGKRTEPYDACGCASGYALGVMALLEDYLDTDMTPEEKITKALEIAERFSAGVSGPFVIECLNEDNTEFTFTEE